MWGLAYNNYIILVLNLLKGFEIWIRYLENKYTQISFLKRFMQGKNKLLMIETL